MKTVAGWITLVLLAVVTLFEGLLLYLGQFGFDFTQGGPEPLGLRYEWLLLLSKLVGLGISRRTSLLMLAAGLADWVFGIVFLRMHSQHESLGAALSDSWVTGAYVLLAVIYIVITGRWWIDAQRARGEKGVAGH
jgi:hypothetical protein